MQGELPSVLLMFLPLDDQVETRGTSFSLSLLSDLMNDINDIVEAEKEGE
jgi:hypothetical protein